jgi:hypothetical protein
MRRLIVIAMIVFTVFGVSVGIARRAAAQTSILNLKMSSVMTAEEQNQTGLAELTAPQRKALDAWLNRYTETVIKIAVEAKASSGPRASSQTTDCVSAGGCR